MPVASPGVLSRFHDRVESSFASCARFTIRWRWAIVLLAALVTGLLASWIPRLQFDNSAESFLLAGDPARAVYDRFRSDFGRDQPWILSVAPPRVFDLEFLERLREFHRELEARVPYVEKITSLINARSIRGETDEVVVEDLMEEWPSSAWDLARLRQRVLANPLYLDTLIDRGATITTVTLRPFVYSTRVPTSAPLAGFDDATDGAGARSGSSTDPPPFLTDQESREQLDALYDVTKRFQAPDFVIHLSGGTISNLHSTEMLRRDVPVSMGACILVIALLLAILFRRLSGVLLPLGVVLASIVATFGLMAMLRIPGSATGQIVPVLLLAVGVSATVHILTPIYTGIAEARPRDPMIAEVLRRTGLPVLMASLTTAAGLLSFAWADLAQVANIGIVAPLGVLMTTLYALLLLPPLISILPLRPRPGRDGEALRRSIGLALARAGEWAARNPGRVLVSTAIVFVVSAASLSRLHFSQNTVNWLPEDDPVRVSVEYMNRELRGAVSTEVVIDTGVENGLYDPETLTRIDRAARFAESIDEGELYVGKAISLADLLKEMNQALNENRAESYSIPDSRPLVAQELQLFENGASDDLGEYSDSLYRRARISLRMPVVDHMLLPGFYERLSSEFRRILGPNLPFEITGMGALFARIFSVLNATMASSYFLAFLMIVPLMFLLIGSLRLGALAMIPNLLPVLATLALMVWLDIPLDSATLLVGSLIIGTAVDDTIHFVHKFGRYHARTGETHQAVRHTLETTGAALLFTSLILSAGFLVMSTAYMRHVRAFGILAGFATIVAFVADVLVMSALIAFATRRRASVR